MNLSLDIASLRQRYQSGALTPLQLMEDLLARLSGEDSHHIWISRLDAAALRADQAAYVLELPYQRLTELVDLQPAASSVWIHCGGEPLGRYDPAFATLEFWLQRLGLAYASVQCTGHAAPDDLRWLVATIAPRVLIPVHSLAPENLIVPGVARRLPEPGVTYDIARLTGET